MAVPLVVVAVLCLGFGIVEPASVAVRPKLVIDHDGGADDAMAIFVALLNERHRHGPEVIAITTTHGNVAEEQSFNNTQRILSIAHRRNVPIYRGNSNALISRLSSDHYFGFDGLGDNVTTTYEAIKAEETHAVLALIELSKKYKDELVIVALGPLTNIALAIQIDPDFLTRLSQLYVAAGHIYGENFTAPEFNANMDVEAYHIVVNNGKPDKLTVIPFSQIETYQVIEKEWRTDVLGSIQTEIMQAQNGFERISLNTSKYWSLLDPSAMTVALATNIVVEETLYSKNDITLCGNSRGVNTNNFTAEGEANVRLIYKVKKEPYQQFLYDLFESDLKQSCWHSVC